MEAPLSTYFDAGVDGADEEDVGEHDEDGDVQAEHERRAVAEGREQAELGRRAHQATPSKPHQEAHFLATICHKWGNWERRLVMTMPLTLGK